MFKIKWTYWLQRPMKNLRETLVPFNRSMLFKTFFFLLVCTVLLVGFIFPSGTRGSFNQKWSLCQGCSGSGLRVFPRHRGSLLSGAGRGPRPPPPPPAGQVVSRGGRCSAAWCWRLGCAGGRRSGGTRPYSSVPDPEKRRPKERRRGLKVKLCAGLKKYWHKWKSVSKYIYVTTEVFHSLNVYFWAYWPQPFIH